jgi:hypothetical protein
MYSERVSEVVEGRLVNRNIVASNVGKSTKPLKQIEVRHDFASVTNFYTLLGRIMC